MKLLRKTLLMMLSLTLLAVTGTSAASVAPDGTVYVTATEAPTTQYEISPTSTRWKVERGGRLIPISASRVKYMRVATFHGTPEPVYADPMRSPAHVTYMSQQQYAPSPNYAPVPANPSQLYAPTPNYSPPADWQRQYTPPAYELSPGYAPNAQNNPPSPPESPYSVPAPSGSQIPYSLQPGDSYPPNTGN